MDNLDYLKPRKNVFVVSATDGRWKRKEQEELFHKIDKDVERWNCIGEKDKETSQIKVRIFDLVNNGTYIQLIPYDENNFFKNLVQGLQFFKDNPCFIKEIIEENSRFLIPFVSQNRRDENGKPFCFVANIFQLDKKVGLRVSKFSRNFTWTTYLNIVVILPQYHVSN